MDERSNTEKYIKKHIERVRNRLSEFIFELYKRMKYHDASKLKEPEYSLWLRMDEEPRYKYGTREYKDKIRRNKRVFDLHYAHNSHHPEHYSQGVLDMDLVDLIEMLIDWISYKDDISIKDAIELIEMQSDRYNLSEDLKCILKNTLFNHYSRLNYLVDTNDHDCKINSIHENIFDLIV